MLKVRFRPRPPGPMPLRSGTSHPAGPLKICGAEDAAIVLAFCAARAVHLGVRTGTLHRTTVLVQCVIVMVAVARCPSWAFPP